MKKLAILLVMSCLSATLVSATEIGLFGALWDTDDFGDTGGIGGKLILGGDPIGLEIRGTYFDDLSGDTGQNDWELEAIPVEVGLIFESGLTEDISLLLGGGAGYYFLDSTWGDVDDEIGFYASGGLSLQLTEGISVFGEAIYRWVNGTVENDDFGDFESGTDFDLDGIGINVGLLFN